MKKISDATKHDLSQVAKFGLPALFLFSTVWGYTHHFGEPGRETLILFTLMSLAIMHRFIVIEYRLKYKLGLIDWEWQTFTSHFCAFVSCQLKRRT
jgi:hypothetical protein